MKPDLFLATVRTPHFVRSKKSWGIPPFEEARNRHVNFRITKAYDNPHPERLYTVIGKDVIREGYTYYLGSEDGYTWVHMRSQPVLLLANGMGKRYMALENDVEMVAQFTRGVTASGIQTTLDTAIDEWIAAGKQSYLELRNAAAPYVTSALQDMRRKLFGSIKE